MGHNLHVLGDKFLTGGQEVADHIRNCALHRVGMEDQARNREHHHDEWEQRQDGIGGDAEGIGMHFRLRHVAGKAPDLIPQARVAGKFRGRLWFSGNTNKGFIDNRPCHNPGDGYAERHSHPC